MQSGVPPILSRVAPSRNAGFETILNTKLDLLWQKSGVLDIGSALWHWKNQGCDQFDRSTIRTVLGAASGAARQKNAQTTRRGAAFERDRSVFR
jgi:hypothetical protein